VKRNAAGG